MRFNKPKIQPEAELITIDDEIDMLKVEYGNYVIRVVMRDEKEDAIAVSVMRPDKKEIRYRDQFMSENEMTIFVGPADNRYCACPRCTGQRN